MPEAQRCYGGIVGEGAVCFPDDVFQSSPGVVDALGGILEGACSQQAVPPGILRLPAGDGFFHGKETVQDIVTAAGLYVAEICVNYILEGSVHALHAVYDFEQLVVEIMGVDVGYHVGAVAEQLFHEGHGIDGAPQLVTFLDVGGGTGVVHIAPVVGTDKAHQVLAGFQAEIHIGSYGAHACGEGGHADDAAARGTCVGIHMGFQFLALHLLALEKFREVFHHALCNSLMLGGAYLGQVTGAGGRLLGKKLGGDQQALSIQGQGLCGIRLLEGFEQVVVFVGAVMVAASMATVMADIERLYPLGALVYLTFLSGSG